MFAGRAVARDGDGREMPGRVRAALAMGRPPASCSDSASSCRMISAFSHFSARLRLGLPNGVSRKSAATVNTPSAIIKVGEMPNMFQFLQTSGSCGASMKSIFLRKGVGATGYQGCWSCIVTMKRQGISAEG
jgi:hypothetical protein